MHVLILPSQLPADLRLTFRELDEAELVSSDRIQSHDAELSVLQNHGVIPDHMNLLSSVEATEHVRI